MKVVSFKIDVDLLNEVDRVAKAMNVSRSTVIRAALEKYIESIQRMLPGIGAIAIE
ncbi:MAG: ribbon-helix-helix domain-containing protein [Desulfurococcaceae archaeon]